MNELWDAIVKDKTDPLTDRPFSGLKALVDGARKVAESKTDRPRQAQKTQKTVDSPAGYSDEILFLTAVKDIIPLHEGREDESEMASELALPKALIDPREVEKAEILEALKALVSGATPFPVKQTPEFVKGPGPNTNEWLVNRLHRGEFSVQGYCELHGLDTLGALDACEAFLCQAISEGKRCVAFIHGRGLSSPKGPVLKDAVTRWIAHGRYRRLVLAYSSAPAWDGGAGVTYVLLRRRPQKRMAS